MRLNKTPFESGYGSLPNEIRMELHHKYKTVLAFLFLLLFAFLTRFVQLGENPSGFFRDEADKGYTTYSLLQTGKDQSGRRLPFFVRSLHVTTSSLYQYLDIPFVMGLGLTEQAVRLPACFAGTLSVLAVFLLLRLWWGNRYALWGALFVSLSPWNFLLSRWANQSSLLMAWIPLGMVFFYLAVTREKKNWIYLIGSVFFFLLALYTYAPARLVIPVLLVCVWGVSLFADRPHGIRGARLWKMAGVFWGLFLLGCIPLAQHILFESAQSTSRLSQITIWGDQPILPAMLEFIKNYALHVSPGFLFFHGDGNLRHSTAVFGQVHWYVFPLLLAGMIRCVRRREWIDRLLLVWLFCFPLAAACTRESIPHALRSVFAVPILQILSVYGMMEWEDWIKKSPNRFSPTFIIMGKRLWILSLVICAGLYFFDYYVRYPVYSAVHWEYGYREAITWWRDRVEEDNQTVVSGIAEYPYIFFLYYDRYSPQAWIENQEIAGVTFIPTGQPVQRFFERGEQTTFYLLRPHELPGFRADKAILLPSGDAIW
ncbi:phospholipid carrier-dependent glycosyltransferase, partial [bacterium]|nr:phospholipid carrier-dependent glycosyltransferase [bacterium]